MWLWKVFFGFITASDGMWLWTFLGSITASMEGIVNVVIEYIDGFNRIMKWVAELPDIKWHVLIHWLDSGQKRNPSYMS